MKSLFIPAANAVWCLINIQYLIPHLAVFFLFVFLQIDEDPSLVPETIQGGTFGFNSSANVPTEGFQF